MTPSDRAAICEDLAREPFRSVQDTGIYVDGRVAQVSKPAVVPSLVRADRQRRALHAALEQAEYELALAREEIAELKRRLNDATITEFTDEIEQAQCDEPKETHQ
jgi:hypothetical protein